MGCHQRAEGAHHTYAERSSASVVLPPGGPTARGGPAGTPPRCAAAGAGGTGGATAGAAGTSGRAGATGPAAGAGP
eukprot:1363861-Alexandrium_andersonii.AAC.1